MSRVDCRAAGNLAIVYKSFSGPIARIIGRISVIGHLCRSIGFRKRGHRLFVRRLREVASMLLDSKPHANNERQDVVVEAVRDFIVLYAVSVAASQTRV